MLMHICGAQIHVPDPDSDGVTSGLWGDAHLSHTGQLTSLQDAEHVQVSKLL